MVFTPYVLKLNKKIEKKDVGDETMDKGILEQARQSIGPFCKVCLECNGRACRGLIPGPGGKGTGIGFIRNYEDLRKIALQMDTIHSTSTVDTSVFLFGETLSLPVFAGPVGAVKMHYSDAYDDLSYSEALIDGCVREQTLAFTGDGVDDAVFEGTVKAIERQHGFAIPTIKPWQVNEVIKKIQMSEGAGAKAIAMDIDAAGLSILAAQGKPVSPKPVHELRAIINATHKPFIIKGIMTVEAAKKAVEVGAYGIVISNHGGRVLDETPSTISCLREIANAVGGQIKILIDGGFRSGLDVFKALALGADGVLIARPFVTAVYGGGAKAVAALMAQYRVELRNAMVMTGCSTIDDIRERHVRFL